MRFSGLVICIFLAVLNCSAATLAVSDFTTGFDGWTATGDVAAFVWQPDGFISATTNNSTSVLALSAPTEFLNALPSAYGGTLAFRDGTQWATEVYIRITNSFDPVYGGMMFHAYSGFGADPVSGLQTPWAGFTVPLWVDPHYSFPQEGWLKIGGDYLDATYFQQTLSGATSLKIQAYSYFGAGHLQLSVDDAVLAAPVPEPTTLATILIGFVALLWRAKLARAEDAPAKSR